MTRFAAALAITDYFYRHIRQYLWSPCTAGQWSNWLDYGRTNKRTQIGLLGVRYRNPPSTIIIMTGRIRKETCGVYEVIPTREIKEGRFTGWRETMLAPVYAFESGGRIVVGTRKNPTVRNYLDVLDTLRELETLLS